MRNPKISVIIPVYNASRYIRKTIENMVSQTTDDVEILLVDNDSTDDSAALMGRAANAYQNVRFLNETKRGASAARNHGIENARGEFIVFINASDLQSDEYLRCLCVAMDGVDLAVCGYRKIVGKEVLYETPQKSLQIVTGRDLIPVLFEDGHFQAHVWNKMFRRSILLEYDIRFHENIHVNEERLFLTEYLLHTNKVRMIPGQLYTYRLREKTFERERPNGFPTDKAFTEIDAYAAMIPLLEENGLQEVSDCVKTKMIRAEMHLIQRMLNEKVPRFFKHRHFREHARKVYSFGYQPKNNAEKYLMKKLLIYGLTGVSYKKEK